MFEIHKVGFRGNKNIQNGAQWPLTTNPHFICNIHCIQDCMLTKQKLFWYFDAGLEHRAAHSRGNGKLFDWLS